MMMFSQRFYAIALCFIAGFPAHVAAQSSARSALDINGDGKVDGRDADQLATMLGSTSTTRRVPSTPNSPFDMNHDGMLSFADWQTYVALANGNGAAEAIFDVVANQPASPIVASPDRIAMAQAVHQGSYYRIRFDVNGDGVLDRRDWVTFLDHYRLARPALLVDFDGNGTVNGGDLDVLARVIDGKSFDQSMDLNADGKVDVADYRLAITTLAAISPRTLFDVDGRSVAGQPVISSNDVSTIATSIEGLNVGFPVSIRYDFNGDGLVTPADWQYWVRFATAVYKMPDLVYDISGDGIVDDLDVLQVSRAVGVYPVQPRFDVNGDGVVDARDVSIMQSRRTNGALQLLAGDVNRDGCVTAADQRLVQAAFGASSGLAGWDPDLDVNANGFIGTDDLQLLNANLGKCL